MMSSMLEKHSDREGQCWFLGRISHRLLDVHEALWVLLLLVAHVQVPHPQAVVL